MQRSKKKKSSHTSQRSSPRLNGSGPLGQLPTLPRSPPTKQRSIETNSKASTFFADCANGGPLKRSPPLRCRASLSRVKRDATGIASHGDGTIIENNLIENTTGAGVRVGGNEVDGRQYGINNQVCVCARGKNAAALSQGVRTRVCAV